MKAQSSSPVSEVYFMEEDTFDIYADESLRVNNRINVDMSDSIEWNIYLSGTAVRYTDDYDSGAFAFTPPNPSIALLETFKIDVEIIKIHRVKETCLLDTTKSFVIRVYPAPYANAYVRFCRDFNDNNGYKAYSLRRKEEQPDGKFHFMSYASHVLRVSLPSVSNYEEQWSWSIQDTVLNAGVGPAYKYLYTEDDASEDGKIHSYKVTVRNKLKHRKEAFVDDYEFDCKIYPEPIADVYEKIDTYSGRTFGFGLTYDGGVKDEWKVYWSDLNQNPFTEEEMNAVCHYVDEPTKVTYKLNITNGVGSYYSAYAYPYVMVWKKPEARLCDVNGLSVSPEEEIKSLYNVKCAEGDEVSVSFRTDGGYESDDSWIASTDGSVCDRDGDVVTCRFKAIVPDSIRPTMTSVSEGVSYPLCVKIQNVYTGENYSPDSIWYCDSIQVRLNVVARPMAPVKLEKKGNGNSCTLIATVNELDPYTTMKGYALTYGYEKSDGTTVTHSPKSYEEKGTHRYDVFGKEEYNDKNNRFFVYATLTTESGNIIVGDKCYMDEDKDEEVSEARSYDIKGCATANDGHGIVVVLMSDGSVKKIIQK